MKLELDQQEIDALADVLQLAQEDQENYLGVGNPHSDYGDEWPEVAKRKAAQFRVVATIAERSGLAESARHWNALAECMESSGREYTAIFLDASDL